MILSVFIPTIQYYNHIDSKKCDLRRKFSQFVPDHVLRDSYVLVGFSIVDLELEAHEVGEDGRRACLGLDRGYAFTVLWPDNREAWMV